MRVIIVILLTLLSLGQVLAQTCDKIQMVEEFHKVTITDNQYPKISDHDVSCVQQLVLGQALSHPCIDNSSSNRVEGVHAYYDINGNGETDGIVPSNVSLSDVMTLTQFVNAEDDFSRLAIIEQKMAHINRQYTRRRCDGSLPANCTTRQVMMDMHDFHRDGVLDQQDVTCLKKVVLTGGGKAFHEANPNCARTDDPVVNYNISNISFTQVVASARDVFLLEQVINNLKTPDQLPSVKIVSDLHGCREALVPPDNPFKDEPEDLCSQPNICCFPAPEGDGPEVITPEGNGNELELILEEGITSYDLEIPGARKVPLSYTGGTGKRTLTFTANVPSNREETFMMVSESIGDVMTTMSLGSPMRYVSEKVSGTFTIVSRVTGIFVVDLTVSDEAGNKVTKTITFNAKPEIKNGSPPEFHDHRLPDNYTYIAYAEGTPVSHSFTGSDADGVDTIRVGSAGLPPGSSVQASPSKTDPNEFNTTLRIDRVPAAIGTHEAKILVKDDGGNMDSKDITIIIYEWFEKITDPDRAGDKFDTYELKNFYESDVFGYDVAGDYVVGETIRMNFTYPDPPPGESWSFTQENRLFGTDCDNAGSGAVQFKASEADPNVGELVFTPSQVGKVSICVQASVEKKTPSKLIWGKRPFRLRFEVDGNGDGEGSSDLGFDLSTTDFTVKRNELFNLELIGKGGTPGYGYDLIPVLPLPNPSLSTYGINRDIDKYFFNFVMDQANGTYFFDLRITDANSDQVIQRISITLIEDTPDLSLSFAQTTPVSIMKTGNFTSDLIVANGVGDPSSYTYAVKDVVANPIVGAHTMLIGKGLDNPPSFYFAPDSSLSYTENNLFELEVTVTDQAGQTASAIAYIAITEKLICPVGSYAASSSLCCLNRQVIDPNSGTCVESVTTMAIIDKNDFDNELGSAGFPSLCQIEKVDNFYDHTGNLAQAITFKKNDASSDYFQSNCRKFAQMYTHYEVYHQGGDLNTGLIVEAGNVSGDDLPLEEDELTTNPVQPSTEFDDGSEGDSGDEIPTPKDLGVDPNGIKPIANGTNPFHDPRKDGTKPINGYGRTGDDDKEAYEGGNDDEDDEDDNDEQRDDSEKPGHWKKPHKPINNN